MNKNLVITAFLVFGSTVNVFANTMSNIEYRPYGFLRLSTVGADSGVGSFNAFNQAASTQAAPHLNSIHESSRLTFQAQQSRIGLTMTQVNEFQGKLEFDFLDTAKSSPTTQMQPRLRIASVTLFQDGYRLVIGQDWDLFSPLNPFTFNYVGNYFLAGNAGFLRQQLQYLKDFEEFEMGLAVGLFGSNATNQDGDLEVSKSPSYAGRVAYKLDQGKVGLSLLYSNYKYESVQGHRRDTYGMNLFYDKKLGPMEVKSEVYYGQNLSNSGANTLGKGTADSNVKEWGGYLSLYYHLEKIDLFGGVGYARVTNPGEMNALSLNGNTVVNPGVLSNLATKFGVKKEIKKSVDWLLEVTRYETDYKLASGNQFNQVITLETGIKLTF